MSYEAYNCDYNNPKADTTVQSPVPQQQYYNQPGQTTVQMAQVVNPMMVSVEAKPRWSWALTITSVLTTIFCGTCGCLWGSLGVLQAVHAYIDHKSGDYMRAASKRRCGWGFTIAGLVLGVIMWIIIFIVIGEAITAAQAVVKAAQEASRESDRNNGFSG